MSDEEIVTRVLKRFDEEAAASEDRPPWFEYRNRLDLVGDQDLALPRLTQPPSGPTTVVCRLAGWGDNPATLDDYSWKFPGLASGMPSDPDEPIRLLGGYYSRGVAHAAIDVSGLEDYLNKRTSSEINKIRLKFSGSKIRFKCDYKTGDSWLSDVGKVEFDMEVSLNQWQLELKRRGKPKLISNTAAGKVTQSLAGPIIDTFLRNIVDKSLRASRIDLADEIVRASGGQVTRADLQGVKPSFEFKTNGIFMISVTRSQVEHKLPQDVRSMLDSGDVFVGMVFQPGETEKRIPISAITDNRDEPDEVLDASLISCSYDAWIRPESSAQLIEITDGHQPMAIIDREAPETDVALNDVRLRDEIKNTGTPYSPPLVEIPTAATSVNNATEVPVVQATQELSPGFATAQVELILVPPVSRKALDGKDISAENAARILNRSSLKTKLENRWARPQDIVYDQRPAAGTYAKPGSTVRLIDIRAEVPDVSGKTLKDAYRLLHTQNHFVTKYLQQA